MSAEFHCPKCSSANVIFTKKREAPVAPLRIFLSYGHDANEELVRRIYADLKKRGHDVWFDKTEIKFGDEWRQHPDHPRRERARGEAAAQHQPYPLATVRGHARPDSERRPRHIEAL